MLAIIVEAIAQVGPVVRGRQGNPNGWSLNVPALPDTVVDLPDLSLLGQLQRARLVGAGPAGWSR